MKKAAFSLLILLTPMPSSASADGLVDRVARFECAAARLERAAFGLMTGYDVSGPVEEWGWERIDAGPMPASTPTTIDGVTRSRRHRVEIDYDANYRFIRLRVGEGHRLDYTVGAAGWTNTGWNARMHLLRIDDAWAHLADADEAPFSGEIRHRGAEAHDRPKNASPEKWDDVLDETLRPGDADTRIRAIPPDAFTPIVFMRGCATDTDYALCLREFIVKLPRDARLTALSDVESVSGTASENNEAVYDVELWGLAPPPMEACE